MACYCEDSVTKQSLSKVEIASSDYCPLRNNREKEAPRNDREKRTFEIKEEKDISRIT